MPRTVAFSLPTDTAQFTALQLQPKVLLSLSFSALARWLREHLVSFPDLIRRHGYSLVILGANIRYEQPLGFFDCDELQVEAALRVLRHGKRVESALAQPSRRRSPEPVHKTARDEEPRDFGLGDDRHGGERQVNDP